MSLAMKETGGGDWPRNRSISPAMSSVPTHSIGSMAAKTRWSSRARYSSSDVVTTVVTSVPGTTPAATSRYRLCRQTSTRAPESRSTASSSLARFIGLTGTTTPPAFHVASRPITNCGTFCRYSATRSPALRPSSSSATANASLSSSSSRAVIRPPKYRMMSPSGFRLTEARNMASASVNSRLISAGWSWS